MRKKHWIIFLLLFAFALTSRLCVARLLANDEPGDARVYSRLAVNVLEQHAYSADEGPPYAPTYIRLPGYPLFLAAVYAAFGHGNDAAARIAQALLDTASCLFVAALAFLWQPAEARKLRASALALALAVVCPFTVIYTATILTETLTIFLALALTLAATLALRARARRAQMMWWTVAGLCAGSVIMVRPDGGLFAAGAGLTLVLAHLFGARATRADSKAESLPKSQTDARAGVRLARRLDGVSTARRLARTLALGSVFAAATVLL
ncbi:MAG: glycosyltransferase family 39 protein, partial [Acidobacteriota bacterium]|nr:glycosyltransferase family 39 protein [Acidobacteriota bacterium]